VIIPMARLHVLSQVSQLNISEEDVARGYVDVDCGTHVELRSNARCRLAYRCSAAWFNGVHVYGFPRAIEFGPDGGGYLRPLERQRTATYLLSYRFDLNPATLPGIYRWPLTLAVAAEFAEEAPARAKQGARRMPPSLPA
jgi:hypothetical protein